MSDTRTVLLVDTTVPGCKGSMTRYADLVERCIADEGNTTGLWKSDLLRVGRRFPLPQWFPRIFKTWLNHFWVMMFATWKLSRSDYDLIHVLDGSYGYLTPKKPRAATVITFHDLIPWLQSSGNLEGKRPSILARKLIRRTNDRLQRSDCLIAVSNNSAKDLVKWLDISNRQIAVVYNALDAEFNEYSPFNRESAERRLTDNVMPYVLHLGNNAWYKNREGVIRIFHTIRSKADVKLALAGPPLTPRYQELILELGLSGDIDVWESPDDERLKELYQNAAVFLFPSIYEGFGWPPLEAMALGCPVVCSSAASLPEVVGDAALMAPPDDERMLADHCLAILNDNELATDLKRKGRKRAELFTIERMGEELLSAYDKALEKHASTG